MHTTLSFQHLPPHVVKLIVDHVVGRSRAELNGFVKDSQVYKTLLKPLLRVSRNFRAIALPLYCNYFKLRVLLSSRNAHAVHDLLSSRSDYSRATYEYLGHPTHHLAKELEIELDERTVYSGRALESLTLTPYDGCAFPLVRKLTLNLVAEELDDESKNADIDLSQAETNIGAFVERIKLMTPVVSDIRVQPQDLYPPEINDHLVGSLASQLFQLVNRIDYDHNLGTTTPIWHHLDMIRDLTHITYVNVDNDVVHFLQSVRQNASTLQALDIESEYNYVDIRGLIRNIDGSYVTYPHLTKLYLYWQADCEEHDRVVSRNVVPFPSLQQLMIMAEYPFGDDVVFRGNASTLESLYIELPSSVTSMLCRLGVFTSVSHPRLQCVDIVSYDEDIPDSFDTPADYAQFILGIGPRAHTRRIYVESVDKFLLSVLLLPGAHLCIQVLKLESLRLSLWEIFTLVKSLPLLSDLHARCPTIDNFPYTVTKEELVAHVISNYTMISKRFQFWHIVFSHKEHARSALCVLLLALVCPNFNHAATYRHERESFIKAMDDTINSAEFKPYAPRLQRLLLRGRNGTQD
ncbi:hypothetical protein FBU31_001945 [Coemansia sp. 'formosensis']|nr:hypothetical protein FBU31_001945 [Coemansia sp. 'formosensis']